jgi:hypothetical protein
MSLLDFRGYDGKRLRYVPHSIRGHGSVGARDTERTASRGRASYGHCMASEVPLSGGRVTEGVTRAGDTVRRPLKPNSLFVRALLVHLHDHGFGGAPRYLGVDDRGREVFSFLSGEVPPELDPAIPDELLALAARLIRRYHDAAASSPLIRCAKRSATTTFRPATSSSETACRSASSTSTPPLQARGCGT